MSFNASERTPTLPSWRRSSRSIHSRIADELPMPDLEYQQAKELPPVVLPPAGVLADQRLDRRRPEVGRACGARRQQPITSRPRKAPPGDTMPGCQSAAFIGSEKTA